MKQRLKKQYITAAAIMLVSSVAVKVISAFYKIPLTAYIGAEGRGYFTVAYNLCLPVHALTMGAFPVALTKLVSTADAKGDNNEAYALKAASRRLFFIVGLIGMAVMLVFAKPYAEYISASPGSVYTILALAPSVFFSCLCASRRAYAEGFLDMKLTSAAQLIEAVSKMLFGLLFARLSLGFFYNEYINSHTVMGSPVMSEKEALAAIYPLSSALAMLGASVGSILAYIFAAVYDKIKYKTNTVGKADVKAAYNSIMTFSVSLVGATVVQSLANFLDTSSIQFCLTRCSESVLSHLYNYNGSEVYTYVLGIYAAALDFRNLVPSIVMALGVTAVPAVSAAYESSSESFSNLLESIFKYSTILSSLGGLVLVLFRNEILTILFSKNNPDIAENATELLLWFGLTVIPSGVATTVVFCTQALGFAKESIPSFIVGAAVRILLNFLLVSNSEINVKGAAVSNFFGFLLIVIWNVVIIMKKTNVKIRLTHAFIKPIICSAIVFFIVDYIKIYNYFSYNLFISFAFHTTICLMSFALLLLLTKCITLRDFAPEKLM